MELLQMSMCGAVFIAVVVMIRAVTINRLPKKTFLVLWSLVLIRLLIPFSIPSAYSAYALIPVLSGTETGSVFGAVQQGQSETMRLQIPANDIQTVSVWHIIWCVGMVLCAAVFIVCYLRCLFEFQVSYPVDNDYVEQWVKEHPLKRPLSVRQSDRIPAPLTYGIFRPVILMPQKTDWQDTKQLQYILLHEFVHICRFDTVMKLITIAALCVHWFNPMVWVMYVLFNRDMELSCDESVIQKVGETSKSAYALMLIDMEVKKSGFTPLCNDFSKNAIEERITAIMKMKKTTIFSLVLACLIVAGTAIAFATFAGTQMAEAETPFAEDGAEAINWDAVEKNSVITVMKISKNKSATIWNGPRKQHS